MAQRRTRLLTVAAAAAVALTVAGTQSGAQAGERGGHGPEPAAAPTKVVVIVVDALSKEIVDTYGMRNVQALMKDGVLQQVDTPSNIYGRPANTFVASFIGSPAMNLYHAGLGEKGADGASLKLGSRSLHVPEDVFRQRPELARHAGGEVIVGIRPEDMEDLALVPGHPDNQTLTADIYLSEALGSDNIVHFNLDAPVAEVIDPDTLSDISKSLDSGSSACVARFDAKSAVRTGASRSSSPRPGWVVRMRCSVARSGYPTAMRRMKRSSWFSGR